MGPTFEKLCVTETKELWPLSTTYYDIFSIYHPIGIKKYVELANQCWVRMNQPSPPGQIIDEWDIIVVEHIETKNQLFSESTGQCSILIKLKGDKYYKQWVKI